MASHGAPRVQPGAARTAQAREKELGKIKGYQKLVDRVHENIAQKHFNANTLKLTSEVLVVNPEYYTIWNYRRRILQALFTQETPSEDDPFSFENIERLIAADLEFLLPLLVKSPKCYWIWNHRAWLLQQSTALLPLPRSKSFWQEELNLIGKMHARDPRNFHGWSYRRIIIASLERITLSPVNAEHDINNGDKSEAPSDDAKIAVGSMVESEFDYTTKMIRSNLSNFSAWHARSKMIPRLLDERNASLLDRRKFLDSELALIWNALIDPYDQSLWFYHQYLMSVILPTSPEDRVLVVELSHQNRLKYLKKEIYNIRDLLEEFQDCKWVYLYLILHTARLETLEGKREGSPATSADIPLWLSKLQSLDPLRKGRWDDLRRSVGLGC